MCLAIWLLNGFKDSLVLGKADRQVFHGVIPSSRLCDDDDDS